MKKNIIAFALVIPFTFFGCATTTKQVPKTQKQEYDINMGEVVDNPLAEQDRIIIERQCQSVGAKSCYDLGVSYYRKGDFKTAINTFDVGCAMYQYLPSCLQMGRMFEKGEGVPVNKAAALDIYERACFSGDKPSCQDMRRLK
ncbi:hypothetical protein CBLAS_0308 [Campylobacter blaseri]|uniref:beta-lactamase n=1 Tax=Campylobacter blaseri TaxID=2042961 RepID=A0A2P8R1E9_9BACT|nr:sel1 repeat family protein [Campylobacter blaseri]PSM52308.1 hypothetical protein CQ405_04450 [Campylobacter blaseri]PSM54074.1 hypothetical protein CRN67_04450 [Campylobacter blaseri]QKF85516.1 hypothetical protein CBLAS_0308 [Campylobacter blaseri]